MRLNRSNSPLELVPETQQPLHYLRSVLLTDVVGGKAGETETEFLVLMGRRTRNGIHPLPSPMGF
jgi:hypothetical protein